MKRMIRIFLLLIGLVVLLTACSPVVAPSQNPSPPGVSSTRIVVGIVPMERFAIPAPGKQKWTGFEIDVILALAADMGYQVEWAQSDKTNDTLALINQCNVDVGIAAIAPTEDLKTQTLFSLPYYATSQVLLVKDGNLVITGLDSLQGMTVGTQAGTLSEIELRKLTGINLETFDSYQSAVQELVSGLIDAVILDHPRAVDFLKVKRNNLKIVGEPFGTIDYRIAVCNQRQDLLDQINPLLEKMVEDGTLTKIAKKWQVDNP